MTFELRTYHVADGRMEDLLERFRSHTAGLFREHGMQNIGYWISVQDPSVLMYILRHDDDPETNCESFRADARWVEARTASLANGPLTSEITSVYMESIDIPGLP